MATSDIGRSKNIIAGAALVFIGEGTATLPDFEANKSYGETLKGAAGFRSVGFTSEGVEFSNEPTFTGVEVDQLLDEARLFKTSIRNSLNTTFAEGTLENLLVVWGQSDSTLASSANGTKVLKVVSGELGDAPLERQVVLVGPGVEGDNGKTNERVYRFGRAISVESSSFAARRSEATTYPVSFRLLPGDNGEYGDFVERPRTW